MKLDRLLHTATTADLYDLLAATLNELSKRDKDLNFGPVGIDTQYADITPDHITPNDPSGEFIVTYYSGEGAEAAAAECGPPEGRE